MLHRKRTAFCKATDLRALYFKNEKLDGLPVMISSSPQNRPVSES